MFYTFSSPHHFSWTEQLLFTNPSEEPLLHRVSHIATQLIELNASGRYRSCQQAALGICFQGRTWCWVMLVIPLLVGESLRPSPWLAERMHVNLIPALHEMNVLACSYCRGLEYSIPSMPLWHMDYFELKTKERKQTHRYTHSALSLSTRKGRKILINSQRQP